ncbi:MBL fold metallo-hydrolase [Paenibacillus sp. G2S3]|uniref:MBL fold metallo-hydrolase n=1 Tax=Paenibacillus sp. G2S3 TaxID=3047872 RepID=UPI0024C195E4|nr:MBL fold metallo-hydrolase [Paenibacillus sp. G2S3]WHY18485.1 MBL fold metallo-hydrolase [Paenibacillus sp. G2S3]
MSKAEITSWDKNILQVSVPMDSPLRQVNSYILSDEDGRVTIIDPGPRSPDTENCWLGILQELDLSWMDIRDIVVTHHHPDHYGLAGWLQSLSGCKVWMTERAHAEARLMWGLGTGEDLGNDMDEDTGIDTGIDTGNGVDNDVGINEILPDYFIRHGMTEQWSNGIKAHLESFNSQVEPQPVVSYLNVAEPFKMGGREWQLIITGGHAPGHVSLYHAGSGHMICGDAVLPQISPNVSLLPGSDPQPLQTFLQGLRELGSYSVSMAFPGHREPFAGFAHRVNSLLAHHEERLDTAAALLTSGPLSGFAVCEFLFRSRVTTVHQMRFAMSETLAHLAELVRRGRAVMLEADGGFLFAASESVGEHIS